MKIAVFSFSNPFVNNQDGGKIDIKNRLIALNKLGFEIDQFSILKKNEQNINNNIINNNYLSKINNSLKYIFSKNPISVNNRWDKKLADLVRKNNYDIYLIENFNMFKYVYDIPKDSKIILRVHNIESMSRYELFKSNPFSIRSILELIESKKYCKIERKSLEYINKFIFISQKEKMIFEKKYPEYKEKYEWLPSVCEVSEKEKVVYGNGKYLLYYGDLTVSHNINGIKKFIENVYCKLYLKNKIGLKIVGKITDKDKNDLRKYDGIEVLGYVDDLDSIINEAKFVIAPIYTGAGVKIKVIHAISKGKVLITTPKGIEGTGLKKDFNVLSAETYEQYLTYCTDALRDSEYILDISNKGYCYIKKYYTEEYQLLKLKEILKEGMIK